MRQRSKKAFRPAVESIELRIAASSGLSGAAHALATKAHQSPKAKHHATHKAKDQAAAKAHAHPKPKPHKNHKPKGHPHPPVVHVPSCTPPVARPVPIRPVYPPPGVGPEAWVKIVNTTGQDLRYQISLGPYQDGKFLTFVIAANGPDSVQYRYASLIVNGREVEPSFAIKFENGPVVALNTGPSAQSARGYYIFFDTNLQPYAAPFIDSKAT
ncbi:hypothetical protein P12x_001004 [Tundrisphaera lichenicola]|uniref:hypothetical protein n=1 Tax=Tundrisphaera lichenicola TaxID=2029860 RepID=UPI003EC0B3F8